MLVVKMAQLVLLVLLILGDKKIFDPSISVPAKQIYVKAKCKKKEGKKVERQSVRKGKQTNAYF